MGSVASVAEAEEAAAASEGLVAAAILVAAVQEAVGENDSREAQSRPRIEIDKFSCDPQEIQVRIR